MRNRVIISSLIIGLGVTAGGIANAQYGGSRSDSGMSDKSSSGMKSERSGAVGQYIDDAAVTTRVKSRFARDDQVSAMNINVETSNGVVQLSGYAGSEAEKSRAAEIAREIPDVRDVKNNIIIRGGTSRGGMKGGSETAP